MNPRRLYQIWLTALFLSIAASSLTAQSFRVQCPASTVTHPDPSGSGVNNSEPNYIVPTQYTCSVLNGCKDSCTASNNCSTTGTAGNVGYLVPANGANGALKCQQISGGDGYASMGDGTQTYMFSFGPLSGLADIMKGQPGTEYPGTFNTLYTGTSPLVPGDPATTVGAAGGNLGAFSYNGAVGQTPDIPAIVIMTNIVEGPLPAGTPALSACSAPTANTVTAYVNTPLPVPLGAQVVISNSNGSATPVGYLGTFRVVCIDNNVMTPDGFNGFAFTYIDPIAGLAANTGNDNAGTAAAAATINGHVDPRPIMDVAVMNGNIPAPLIAFDEDDEMFLTLTNVGMLMRPDLFEQHTVHFHGYPNASSFYDGVPDASVAINIGGSFTYYYMSPDAGTYFWHCHITPPEHLQMGMVGQLYVRPRQNRVPVGGYLYNALQAQQTDLRTACNSTTDILCSNPLPAGGSHNAGPKRTAAGNYAYNDGDGTTYYDVEYPLQMHGFDPNFHFVGMTFNPEAFADMKDKYFLLNGRSYPDTIKSGPLTTESSDGSKHFSQPLPSIVNIQVGQKALLRISNLSVSEYHTLASMGIPMQVIALNAKLLRDQEGNNLYYNTNSITLGGGESLDVILDASDTSKYTAGQVFYLYTPNLDHLSNDAENFGGLMTEVHICGSVSGGTTFGNTCTN